MFEFVWFFSVFLIAIMSCLWNGRSLNVSTVFTVHCQFSYDTPPALSPDTPQCLTGGVECYFYSPRLRLLQQDLNIALIMHNKTLQKRPTLRTKTPTGLRPWTLLEDPLTQLDTPPPLTIKSENAALPRLTNARVIVPTQLSAFLC